jgi:hypothetical protein
VVTAQVFLTTVWIAKKDQRKIFGKDAKRRFLFYFRLSLVGKMNGLFPPFGWVVSVPPPFG